MDTAELSRKYRGNDDMPQAGHIISSKEFANGAWSEITIDGPTGVIEINGRETTRGMMLFSEKLFTVIARTGNPNHPHSLEFDVTCNDASRGEARYIVVVAKKTGGCTDSPPFVVTYPNGWRVTARRLTPEGVIDMGAPVIEFYTERMRWHQNYVSPSEITFHGIMPVPPEALRGIY